MDKLFVVRYFDGSDHNWSNSSGPLSREEAEKYLSEKTEGGTQNTCYADGDYFAIFPADTRMLYECVN